MTCKLVIDNRVVGIYDFLFVHQVLFDTEKGNESVCRRSCYCVVLCILYESVWNDGAYFWTKRKKEWKVSGMKPPTDTATKVGHEERTDLPCV